MENVELKNRKQLANFLDKINAKVVVEVGVREGYFSKYILDRICDSINQKVSDM